MAAIEILKNWINRGVLPEGITTREGIEQHYYHKLIAEPINVAIIDAFPEWLENNTKSEKIRESRAKKLYLNILDRSDQRHINNRAPVRFNKKLDLFDEYFHDNLRNLAALWKTLATEGFLNYGCLTRMMILPIIPKEGEPMQCLCYQFLYSDYTLAELNGLCECEMFSDENMPLSLLTDNTLPNVFNINKNIQRWNSAHTPTKQVILLTMTGT